MSMDKIWLCPSLDQGTWVERGEMEKQGKAEEFRRKYDRLHSVGNYVTLAHGQNILIDEMYLFGDVADAEKFYAADYRQREYLNQEEKPAGFDSVCLYVGGVLAARKASHG